MQILRRILLRAAPAPTAVGLLATLALAHTGSGIAVDKNGEVYFLDTGSGLWKIDTHGRLARLSGTKYHWLALDANDGLTNTTLSSGSNGDILKVGAHPTVILASDWPIAVGQNGNLYYQSGSPGSLQIKQTLPSGVTSVFVTLPSTTAGSPLPHLNGIAAGPDDSVYYTENDSIRRITANGLVSTVATVAALGAGPSIPGTDLHPFLATVDQMPGARESLPSPPHATEDLNVVMQGSSDCRLDWKAPALGADAPLGAVSHYRVERRTRNLTGEQTEDWGLWQATTTDTNTAVKGLVRGVDYDFRIIAINAGGGSVLSNIATVAVR